MMMLPGMTTSPPNFLTPSRWPGLSRPFRVDPPAFFVAVRTCCSMCCCAYPPDESAVCDAAAGIDGRRDKALMRNDDHGRNDMLR
jgi:hypothetical protein